MNSKDADISKNKILVMSMYPGKVIILDKKYIFMPRLKYMTGIDIIVISIPFALVFHTLLKSFIINNALVSGLMAMLVYSVYLLAFKYNLQGVKVLKTGNEKKVVKKHKRYKWFLARLFYLIVTSIMIMYFNGNLEFFKIVILLFLFSLGLLFAAFIENKVN
jgi:hypothetical protein